MQLDDRNMDDLFLTVGNRATEYLQEVQLSLEALDSFLWSTRNDSTCFGLVSGAINHTSCPARPSSGNRRGLLWSLGAGDSGEDSSQKKPKITACPGGGASLRRLFSENLSRHAPGAAQSPR